MAFELPANHIWTVGETTQCPCLFVSRMDASFFLEPTNVNYPILNSNFSRLEWHSTGAFSNYHCLRLTFTRKLSQGLHFKSAYTWSRATDNLSAIVSGELGGSTVQNAFEMKVNRGLADFHGAHNSSHQLRIRSAFGQRSYNAGAFLINRIFLLRWFLKPTRRRKSLTRMTVSRAVRKSSDC